MRIAGVSGFPAELEVDPHALANARESGEHHARSVFAEAAAVVGLLVDSLLRCIWIEVEGRPSRGKCILSIRVLTLPRCDGSLHSLFAHVALSDCSVLQV
jgi:hypothetical protein